MEYRITANWLAGIVAGVVWSALWLVVDVFLSDRGQCRRRPAPTLADIPVDKAL